MLTSGPIGLILGVLIFALVVWGAKYLCDTFDVPKPIRWIVGVLLIVVLIVFLSTALGVGINRWPAG
jgi:cytochrome c oxidase subunit IV